MIATTTATVTVIAMILVSSSIRGSIVVVDAFSSQQIIITPTKTTTRSILAGRNNNHGNRSKLPLIFDDDWRTTTHVCTASSSSPFSSMSTKTRTKTRMMTTTSLNLSTDDDDEIENNNLISGIDTIFSKFFSFSSLMALWLPLFAIRGIPALVDNARSFSPNSPQQFQAVTILIVLNRIYLYSLALTIVGLAAIRGSKFDPPSLGQRLTSVTEELLVFDRPLQVVLDNNNKEGEEEEVVEGDESVQEASKTSPPSPPPSPPSPSFIQKMVDDSGLEENLDNVNTETQAILLPVLVSGLLAASVLSLPIWEDGINLFGSASSTTTDNNELLLQLKKAIADIIPVVSQGWNALLLALFTRAEIRRIGYELFGLEITNIDEAIDGDLEKSRNTVQIIIEIVIAISITGYGAYYLQYWPACNFVNMSIAILVARAIQLNTFQSIVGALTLLTIYDGASVFLIPAANAFVDSSSSSSSIVGVDSSLLLSSSSSSSSSSNTLIADASASASAMGSVAIQKLTSTSFQPGLLVAKLDGDKITGALGLGDAVFPSILATFLKRFDNEQQTLSTSKSTSTSLSLFGVSLVGYIIGCILCELAPTISTGGLPALVFILPSMLISVTGGAIVSNQFDNLWNYNSSSSDPTTTGSSNK